MSSLHLELSVWGTRSKHDLKEGLLALSALLIDRKDFTKRKGYSEGFSVNSLKSSKCSKASLTFPGIMIW